MKQAFSTESLGAICGIEIGRTPSRSNPQLWDASKKTGNVWLSIADLANGQGHTVFDSREYISHEAASQCRLVSKGTLLVSFKLTLGRLAFAGRDLYTNEAIAALRLKTTEVSPAYLYYYLTFFDWEDACQGDTKIKGRTLNKAKLARILVRVPPLPEQRRIVAILDKAFAAIDKARANTEKNLANARELFESYLNEVFTKRGEGWQTIPLAEAVTVDCTLSYGIVQPGPECDTGLPVVRPVDLLGKAVGLAGLKRIKPILAARYKRTTLQGNELLLAVRGSTGVVALAAPELEGANVTRGIVPVRLEPTLVHKHFSYYLFLSPLVKDQIAAATYGAALQGINIADVRKVRLALPPLGQQAEIAASLEAVDRACGGLGAKATRRLATLDELKKSLLHQAFEGEL